MYDHYLKKSYSKYLKKKIKINFNSRYSCKNEVIGILIDIPDNYNSFIVPFFKLHVNNKNTFVPVNLINNIYLIREDYTTLKTFNKVINKIKLNDDVCHHIIKYLKGLEYQEIEI